MNRIMSLMKVFRDELIKILYRERNSIMTIHARPKYAHDYTVFEIDKVKNESVAIIIQGNICYDNNFTVETIKLYKKLYPKCLIVLSTWDNENLKIINDIKKLGVCVVESSIPNVSGHGNLNYQLISTMAGVKIAKEKNVQYILKTRTDQRLCSSMNITYMLNLLKLFPLKLPLDCIGRIVVCSNGTFSNRLYNVSDMVLFGRTLDIANYFSAPLDNRSRIDYSQEDFINYSRNRPGEIYIATHYIESLGFNLKWTKSDSDYYLKELFIVVDSEALDWVWPNILVENIGGEFIKMENLFQ